MSFPQRSDLLARRFSSLEEYRQPEGIPRLLYAGYQMASLPLFSSMDEMYSAVVSDATYLSWTYCRPDGSPFADLDDFLEYADAQGIVPSYDTYLYLVGYPRIALALAVMKSLYAARFQKISYSYDEHARKLTKEYYKSRTGVVTTTRRDSYGGSIENYGVRNSSGTSGISLDIFLFSVSRPDVIAFPAPSVSTRLVPTNIPASGVVEMDTPLDLSDPDEAWIASRYPGETIYRSVRFSYSETVPFWPTQTETYYMREAAYPQVKDRKRSIEVLGGTVPDTYDP